MRPNEAAVAPSVVAPVLLEELKRRASCGIEACSGRLWGLSREIWGAPELAYEERRAHEALAGFFSGCGGWRVQRSYKLETAFRAEWQWGPGGGGQEEDAAAATAASPEASSSSTEPVLRVGFLCEYDALPGLGHACGHNLIAEVGAAAALGLRAALQGTQPRPQGGHPAVKISVLGTPAEEGGAGKAVLIKAGAFEDLDVVFMAHPFQEDLPYKPAMADRQVTVKYFGKASHAAAYPWEGVNALDAAVLAYNNLSALRQQIKPTWRLHGIIKMGGEKPNIIPSFTELEFYLRTPLLKELSVLTEKAESCFKAAALATGCTVEITSDIPVYYNVLQNKSLEQAYVENGKRLGIEFPDKAISSASLGSTDFGNVSYVVPGIHPYFYIGSDALNHTEQFTVAAGSEEAHQYALRTAKALAMTALDVIFKPGLLHQVQDDFRQTKLEEQDY